MPMNIANKVISAVKKDPKLQKILLGAGIGAGAGMLGSNKLRSWPTKGNYLQDALTGAALGGLGGSLYHDQKTKRRFW